VTDVHGTEDPGTVLGSLLVARRRRRGVGQLSRRIQDDGHTTILYTQLTNPTSNAIYRRIGFEPVLEVLRYAFDAPDGP
jgi:hypothetical protein